MDSRQRMLIFEQAYDEMAQDIGLLPFRQSFSNQRQICLKHALTVLRRIELERDVRQLEGSAAPLLKTIASALAEKAVDALVKEVVMDDRIVWAMMVSGRRAGKRFIRPAAPCWKGEILVPLWRWTLVVGWHGREPADTLKGCDCG